MPELTPDELSALFAWIVDAQAFLPLSEAAKPAVDKLIAYQQELKKKQAPASADGYAEMWSDKNIAEFGNLL